MTDEYRRSFTLFFTGNSIRHNKRISFTQPPQGGSGAQLMKRTSSLYAGMRKYLHPVTIFAIFLLPVVILVHILSVTIPSVAEFINNYPARGLRFVLAKITGILPFSLAELIIMLLPLLLLSAIIVPVVMHVRGKEISSKKMVSFIAAMATLLLYLYFSFVFTLGAAYHTKSLPEKMGLDDKEVSDDELYDTALIVLKGAQSCLDDIEFSEGGASVMPYSFSELNDKLNTSYKTVAADYDFISSMSSKVKPVIMSEPMTYTHISGVYTYFTGEANINVNFPDYSLPYTMAHEMAHQRGIAREDEANFIAYLVCIGSDDSYIKYSGYMGMYEYFINALAESDDSLFSKLYRSADDRIKGEIGSYNEFFDKYADTPVADISQSINNGYQQIQGIEEGTKSYGLVVDITVAYYKTESS